MTPISRRAILLALPVATIAAAVGPNAVANAAGPAKLTFTISNNSGLDQQLFLYVLGTDLATGRLGYVNQSGNFTPWPRGANPPAPAPDVSITGAGKGGSSSLQVPKGFSGRIYLAFGSKLDFRLTPDGLVQPAESNPSDPNYNILFDFSEFTYNDAGIWLNSSQVDMFAVPHTVSVSLLLRLMPRQVQRLLSTVVASITWIRLWQITRQKVLMPRDTSVMLLTRSR